MAFVRLELDQAIEKQGGGKIAIVIVAEDRRNAEILNRKTKTISNNKPYL